MKSIIHDLPNFTSLKYFGIRNLATGWDFDDLIKNTEKIIEHFNNSNCEINDIDQYIDYLFVLKVMKMNELMDYIKNDESKTKFKILYECLSEVYKKYNNKEIIQYIDKNIEDILSKNDYILGLDDSTIELIIRFQKSISDETIKLIILQKPYLILDHYEGLSKKIESSKDLMNTLCSENIIDTLIQYRSKDLLNNLEKIYEKEKTKSYAEKIIKIIVNKKKSIIEEINSENALFYSNDLQEIYEFLNKIKHPDAQIFEKRYSELDELIDEYLKKHGQSIEHTISLEKLSEFFDSPVSINSKVLSTTHYYDKEKKIVDSNLNVKLETNSPIVDLFTNVQCNDYFKASVQNMLNTKINLGSHIVYIISNKSINEEYFNFVAKEMYTICNEMNLEIDEIMPEFKEILSGILSINQDKSIKILEKYGLFMFICSFTEKFLRCTMSKIDANERYIDPHKVTLSNLLINKTIIEFLGEWQTKHISFMFLSENGIGNDWRNRLAHWDGISFEDLNINRINGVFYCLLSIINSYFLKLGVD